MSKTLPLLLLLLPSVSAFAQTTTTYEASTGSITPTFVMTMNLDGGGSATVYAKWSPYCTWATVASTGCRSTTSTVNYSLPDGSTAHFYPVDLSFTRIGGSAYQVVSTNAPSATDSNGREVTLNNATADIYTVTCHQPRGTCPPQKKFGSGSISVTQ